MVRNETKLESGEKSVWQRVLGREERVLDYTTSRVEVKGVPKTHNSTAPKNAPSNALFHEFGCRDLVAVTGSSAATRLAAFFHRCLASCCLPPFVTAATLRVGVGLGTEIVLGASTSCSSGAM